jgi:hypothetical protein
MSELASVHCLSISVMRRPTDANTDLEIPSSGVPCPRHTASRVSVGSLPCHLGSRSFPGHRICPSRHPPKCDSLYWPLARSRAVERRESMPIRSAANIPFAIKAMRAQPPRLPEPDAAARLPTAVAFRDGLGALVAPRTAAEGRPLLGAAVGSLSVDNALGSADLVVEVGPNEAGPGE